MCPDIDPVFREIEVEVHNNRSFDTVNGEVFERVGSDRGNGAWDRVFEEARGINCLTRLEVRYESAFSGQKENPLEKVGKWACVCVCVCVSKGVGGLGFMRDFKVFNLAKHGRYLVIYLIMPTAYSQALVTLLSF